VTPGVDVPETPPIGLRPRRSKPRQMALVRDRATPVVRWAGGKGKILDQIVPRLPVAYRRYFEPFFGGGAVFFRLRPECAIVSDTCAELIELYREIVRDAREVSYELRQLTAGHALESFGEVRSAWNFERSTWTSVRRAATFLYLNKSCFNGLWRVNQAGDFNVPVGSFGRRGPSYPALADLVVAADQLRRAEIVHGDYLSLFERALPGDLVYADPPYLPRSKTSNFSTYTSVGFGEADHRALAQHVLGLMGRGVQVAVSQPDVPLVREIYAGLRVHEVSAPRSINATGSGRGAVPELLLVGGWL
jgi:DNA adenine methylase